MRRLEASNTVFDRSGEGTANMPEEFAFIEFLRDRRAIHPDERALASSAAFVNFASNEFLARAGLSQNQNGRISCCDHFDLPKQRPVGTASTNDLIRMKIGLIVERDTSMLTRQQGFLHSVQKIIGIDGFSEKLECTLLHRSDRHRDIAVSRQEDNGDFLLFPAEFPLQFKTIQVRQFDIENKASRRIGIRPGEKFQGCAKCLHPYPFDLQQPFDGLADGRIVIDYADQSIEFIHGAF